MIVYCITNLLDGKKYVGKTVQTFHVYSSRVESNTYIHRAMRKHGTRNFSGAVLSVALNRDVLNQLEKFWIAELNTYAPKGYNLTYGGDGPVGYRHRAKTRRRMSATHKRIGVPARKLSQSNASWSRHRMEAFVGNARKDVAIGQGPHIFNRDQTKNA